MDRVTGHGADRSSGRRPVLTAARVAGLVGAAAYAGLLASTRPFTVEADVVTAVALVAAASAVVVRLAGDRSVPDGIGWRPYLPWLVMAAAVVAWELACFFGGARPSHPTLSSIYDIVARSEAAKAAVVLAWVGLGWALVRT
jgi:hypothetical protein